MAVILLWSPRTDNALRLLSLPVWSAILLHLAAATGPFQVPLGIALVIFFTVGFVAEINEVKRRNALNKSTLSLMAHVLIVYYLKHFVLVLR